MKRVVILGANGQVGTELCPLLAMGNSLHVTAVTRSEFSQAVLHRLGVRCVADREDELSRLLASCDVLVDLAMPSGKNVAALRKRIVSRARELHRQLRPGATMVYASTMSVFCLDPDVPRFTIYGSTKRLGERIHRRLGPKTEHKLYVLRLGQVHGAMQGCSVELMQALRRSKHVEVPDIASFTVFVSSIAEAIERIAEGGVREGTYTMMSEPAWSWQEMVEWFAKEADLSVNVTTYRVAPPSSVWRRALIAGRSSLMKWAERHRERLSTCLWYVRPKLAERLIADRYVRIARQHLLADHELRVLRPVRQLLPVPGERFPGLTDSRTTMPPKHAELMAALKSLTSEPDDIRRPPLD
jgi:dTDP-4-dehydrorhamnose reductase